MYHFSNKAMTTLNLQTFKKFICFSMYLHMFLYYFVPRNVPIQNVKYHLEQAHKIYINNS